MEQLGLASRKRLSGVSLLAPEAKMCKPHTRASVAWSLILVWLIIFVEDEERDQNLCSFLKTAKIICSCVENENVRVEI